VEFTAAVECSSYADGFFMTGPWQLNLGLVDRHGAA
jgi:hypothetical protein